jgi:hypothetical protein
MMGGLGGTASAHLKPSPLRQFCPRDLGQIVTEREVRNGSQARPFRALPKGDALDHIRLADVHIAASAQAYRCEDAGVDSQPLSDRYFPTW